MSTDRKDRIDKVTGLLKKELAALRTGRASATLVDGLHVDAYGARTPLAHAATVTVPEARLLVITPWDKSLLGAIERAIQEANLGLTPSNDGEKIRLPIPALSEERRKELAKAARKRGEDAKVALRNIRRDEREAMDALKKKGKASEDEVKRAHDAIQKETDAQVLLVDKLVSEKEKEILEF